MKQSGKQGMSSQKVQGRCLCGDIAYEIDGNLGIFQYCHCSRCRKFTGSSHAANLLVSPDQFHWLQGESQVIQFEPEDTQHFATAFCPRCGSSMPWLGKTKKAVVVPAGTLSSHPHIEPMQNIFWDSRADWYTSVDALPKYATLPNKGSQ